jgi:hypothetical protein
MTNCFRLNVRLRSLSILILLLLLLLFISLPWSVSSAPSVFSLHFTPPVDWDQWLCPPAPRPRRDIQANKFYNDSKSSILDPVRFARWLNNSKPFNDVAEFVAHMADARHPAARDCAFRWLITWARHRAMLGSGRTNQHDMLRAWTATGLAMSLWRMVALCDTSSPPSPSALLVGVRNRPRPLVQRLEFQEIVRWLVLCTKRAMAKFIKPTSRSTMNNHAYSVGLCCLIVGVLARDDALLAFARRKFDDAVGHIAADGTLPFELQRGRRAVHYHCFSLTHIVLMAEVAHAALGEDWAATRGGASLRALVDRTLGGLRDPLSFAPLINMSDIEVPTGPVRAVAAFALRRSWGNSSLSVRDADLQTLLRETYGLARRENCFDPRSGGNLCDMAGDGFSACPH